MTKKRRTLTPDMARKWAELAHTFFIDALSTTTPLSLDKVTFHGGTNLHLSWGSPRFSEDLDFLVTRDFGSRVREIMPKVEKRMRALATSEDPNLRVEIRDKTKDPDGLLNYRVVLSSPEVVGQVMAKAEFWQVEPEYLQDYDARFVQQKKTTGLMSRISQPIPAATLESAFADKVVALGCRPHLKWRDIFDLWWIRGQGQVDLPERIDTIRHHATAYVGPDGETLSQGLQRFLDRDPEEVVAMADPDLRRWLSRGLWETLNPDGVRDMVENARMVAREMKEALPKPPVPEDREGQTHDEDENPGP